MVSLGEVKSLLEHWESGLPCSCGKDFQQCEFWSGFPASSFMDKAARIKRIENLYSVPSLLLGLIADRDIEVYRDYHNKLFRHLASCSDAEIIVDSSKSARRATGRFLALDRLTSQDVYVLHLVRNGLSVMASRVVTGSNPALQGYDYNSRFIAIRTVISWVTANICAYMLGQFMDSGRYILVRYEDFLTDPQTTLCSIGQFIGFDAEPLINAIDSEGYFQVGHLVGGNRISRRESVKLRRQISRKSVTSLSLYHRWLFACVGGWLNRIYGYS
jgi:hypothetical protein